MVYGEPRVVGWLVVFLAVVVNRWTAVALSQGEYKDVEKTRIFNQTLDHFNSEITGTWKQRYYVNDTLLRKGKDNLRPPLFFIPGGEWSVDPTKGILYGMAHDLAQQHGGLMAIVEHRFYGESLPFGPNESFAATSDRIGLLTIDQAMADYIVIIQSILEQYGMQESPVVALGGSYSGKLSAYMRLKYPFVISMALSASAPIYLDSVGLTDQFAYYNVVESATAKISPRCPAAVKSAFTAYRAMSSGMEKQEALNLCEPVGEAEFGWDPLEFYLVQYFATMAMFNYPPSTSPLEKACEHVLGNEFDSEDDMKFGGVVGFMRLLQALTPANATCFDLKAQAPQDVPQGHGFVGSKGSVACSDWSGCGHGQGGLSWDYQACTQVTQPLGLKENSTMFLPMPWTEEWMTEHCKRRFGVVPQFNYIRSTMGLDDISKWPQPARIIFSNGLQDPWHAGGVLKNVTDTMIAITIPNGAHHQDLNGGASASDTKDMLEARERERSIIAAWLKEY